ncbi:cation/H(+) antiporter 15-like [Phragmites australis]|uniref:cation/H(+) antiporter 15-like n=1 Tax=Phragmites australis TaxID=29695 RepID=UPI002D773D7C|nr:cation/H(+) antiporter 15-like [Phragmites australis]
MAATVVSDPLEELWNHTMSADRSHLLCFYPSKITMSGIWLGDSPLDFSLPLLLFQILVVTSTTRAAALILSPLGLPSYIAEILAGFLLGPSVLGRLPHFSNIVFPTRSLFVLDSMSLLGLIYYTFTIGVEIELHTVLSAGPRSFWFAAASALPPFLVGATTGYIALSTDDSRKTKGQFLNSLSFPIFLGATFCSTAFSVLARNIAELKLAGTDVGQLSISASLINDTFAWAGLTVATALAHVRYGLLPSVWTLVSGLLIFAASYLLVRPMFVRLARRAAEGAVVSEVQECSVLIGVMVAALVADAGGTHAIFGAFVFGLAVPNGPIGVALVEKVEDFVVGTLLPLFFAMSGLRTDTAKVTNTHAAVLLMVAALAAAILKVVAAVGVARASGMPLHDGTSIGLLLNTKGVIELVILNIARNKRIMSDQSFTVLVFMSALITALVTPLLAMVVKPARRLVFYKRRTIAWPQPDAELRILACVHVPRDVPALLTLLDVASPSNRSPVAVHALHLIEFAGRSSALLLINASAPTSSFSSPESSAHGRSQVEMQFKHIAHAFMAYEENVVGASARTFAAVSPYASMHDDVAAAAEDQHSALILLPFHKNRSVDGGMEVFHPAIQSLNTNVQRFSPCTVGILVDRGLGSVPGVGCRVAALFFGGRDDREVVALATRMAHNPGIDLTVLRFVQKGGSFTASEFDTLKERKADDGCLREFLDRANSVGSGSGATVEYRERGVFNASEMVAQIREVEASGKDLLVVGKVPGLSALTAGMAEWSECPELGPIGDLLASRDFQTTASVLVVQSYERPVVGGVSAELGLGGDSLPAAARPPRRGR